MTDDASQLWYDGGMKNFLLIGAVRSSRRFVEVSRNGAWRGATGSRCGQYSTGWSGQKPDRCGRWTGATGRMLPTGRRMKRSPPWSGALWRCANSCSTARWADIWG